MDRGSLFNNINTNYYGQNYFLKKYADNFFGYNFNNITKCAFCKQKGYPSSIALRRGRLILAGTKAQPQTIWASRVDKYDDFSVDELADSGWDLTIGANQAQQIKWMLSSKDLVVSTDIAEWVISDDDLKSPVPVIKEQSRWGSSIYQGELMTESIFFIPKDKKGLIQSLYSFQIDGYSSEDMSIMVSDLLSSGITSHSVMKDPDPIWWGSTKDGKMVGMLYNRAQQINAWSWHDIQGMEFKEVKVYLNPVSSEEGVCAIIRSVSPEGDSSLLVNNQYHLAYMDFKTPSIDFPERAAALTNYDEFHHAGFLGRWGNFSTMEVVQGNAKPIDLILANSFCYQDGLPGELKPYPDKTPKIDIITTGKPGTTDENITTGYCWDSDYVEDTSMFVVENETLGQGRFNFQAFFEGGNEALLIYPTTTDTALSHFIYGLHIESEFISLPMGNASNYITSATTTKINQLRYQVLRDDSNDAFPNVFVSGEYGKPRIQAQVEALDYSAPLNVDKNGTLNLRVNLNNGRGHEVLSGPSSTDTRLRLAITDAKKVDILAAYIVYDSDLI